MTLIKIHPPTEEEKRKRIEKRKRLLKMRMDPDEYYNIFESGDDQYMWMDYYSEKRRREKYGDG